VVFCVFFQGVGILLLLLAKTMPLVWIFAVVFGFSMGGQLALEPLIAGHFFGLRAFGSIFGTFAMAGAMGTAFGPIIAGKIYDSQGDYHWAFLGSIAACMIACIIFLTLKRPLYSD
jgi:MFS family permease